MLLRHNSQLAIFKSIYFFDPNGHRIALAADTVRPGDLERLRAGASKMLDDWSKSKRTLKDAAWLHEREFAEA